MTPGDKLGPYDILEPIGAGGMGEVWKGRDTRLDRIVAIKRLNAQHSARFEQEARAVAALNHPHICQIYDIGPDYLVLEYVEGSVLKGPLPLEEAVRLALQIAEALDAAHAKGIVHRDLKPANILVTPSGIKLLDFGLAKQADSLGANDVPIHTLTLAGVVLGTPLYMAPEQAEGKPADTRSDIFSFGTVLYEMLAGRRAFDSMGALFRDDPEPPPALAKIVMRCLAKQPGQRFQSMAEVRAALAGQAESPPSGPSIAVLPFANMSGDKDNEYFSDGLAEEILNALTRVPGLKVTARTSAFAFRGEKQDIRKIGETLGVRTVLEGSVRRAGNRIRVTAQLINIADGYHLWSERYDRDMTDVFAMQDEISQAIVETLKLKLAPAKAARGPVNLDAYHALLKGRYYMSRGPGDSLRALAYCEEAIALDPGYALAYAQKAMCLFGSAQMGVRPVREVIPQVRQAALKALEFDEALPEAHAILAAVAASFDYDWKEALRHYRLAGSDNLSSAAYRAQVVLLPLRHFDEAIQSMERAIAADPLANYPRFILTQALLASGSYDRARSELQWLMELHEKSYEPYFGLGVLAMVQYRTQDAIAILEKGMATAPWFLPIVGLLGANYRRAGEYAKADAILARLVDLGTELANVALSYYYAVCSDFDRAADCFQRAVDSRHFAAQMMAYAPICEEFRQTPRGRALLAQMNLADAVP